MKEFEIHAQERPWYGSPYWVLNIEARSLVSAIKKAIKQCPKAVWYWYNTEVVHVNQNVLEEYQRLNPGVVFYHH